MTENEAIERIKEQACNDRFLSMHCDDSCLYGAEKCEWAVAIQALTDIQAYRAIGTPNDIYNMLEVLNRTVSEIHSDVSKYKSIGTVEEFKALKEKNVPKKPILNNPIINEFYVKEAHLCPNCYSYINNCSGDYCRDCGQKLDWE